VNIKIFNRYGDKNQDNQNYAVLYQGLGIFETAPGFLGTAWRIDGSCGHVIPIRFLMLILCFLWQIIFKVKY
jgi:hypothetical protein